METWHWGSAVTVRVDESAGLPVLKAALEDIPSLGVMGAAFTLILDGDTGGPLDARIPTLASAGFTHDAAPLKRSVVIAVEAAGTCSRRVRLLCICAERSRSWRVADCAPTRATPLRATFRVRVCSRECQCCSRAGTRFGRAPWCRSLHSRVESHRSTSPSAPTSPLSSMPRSIRSFLRRWCGRYGGRRR